MLDVHPIHEPIHGPRDFLLHIATITIGLLIALSLEAGVEAIHHRHIVHQARENIRREIADNQKQLASNLEHLNGDAARMKANVLVIRQLRDHPRSPHGDLQFTLGWSSFTDAAWRTARETGALNYMPYKEVQELSQLYGQQQYINSLGVTLFNDQGRIPSIINSEKSVEDLQLDQLAQLMTGVTGLSAQIGMLQTLLPDLSHDYTEDAKLEAR